MNDNEKIEILEPYDSAPAIENPDQTTRILLVVMGILALIIILIGETYAHFRFQSKEDAILGETIIPVYPLGEKVEILDLMSTSASEPYLYQFALSNSSSEDAFISASFEKRENVIPVFWQLYSNSSSEEKMISSGIWTTDSELFLTSSLSSRANMTEYYVLKIWYSPDYVSSENLLSLETELKLSIVE